MANNKTDKKPNPVIAENRKARFNYEIIDNIEAGLMLVGTEVKALREGKADLSDAYAVFKGGEVFLLNAYIGEYSHGNQQNHDTRRSRKLLLHKLEISRLQQMREREQLALIPLKFYWSKGKVKVDLGIGKGRKSHDKRDMQKDRDWQRQRQRLLRR